MSEVLLVMALLLSRWLLHTLCVCCTGSVIITLSNNNKHCMHRFKETGLNRLSVRMPVAGPVCSVFNYNKSTHTLYRMAL